MLNEFNYLSKVLDIMGANQIQYIHFNIKQYDIIKDKLLGSKVIDDKALEFQSNGYTFILKFK